MILVVGATGSLGGRITRDLLAKDKQVRILVRLDSPSEELAKMGRATSAQSLIDAGAQPVCGDLKDAASLGAAVNGVDTVISTASATKREAPDTIETVDLQGTLNLIHAAQTAGVRHFIYTSAHGSRPEHPAPLFQSKGKCEAALEASGMDWTVLQPDAFMEGWIDGVVGIPLKAQQPITLVGEANHKHSFVSEADVAAFAVACVDNPAAIKQRIPIGGPASYTWGEILTAVEACLGVKLPVNFVPLGGEIPLLSPGAGYLLNAMETYESFIDMGETAPKYGVDPTPLSVYVQRAFGAHDRAQEAD